jgi:hypothetical protein
MQPQPVEYSQPVQYSQPGQYPQPGQYAQPATQYAQPLQSQQPQFVQSVQPMMQAAPQQFVYVAIEKPPNKAVPWVGVCLILISLFLPYMSFLGESVSGFEMMGYVGEMADMSDGGTDGGGGDNIDLPIEFVFFGIAALMVGFGPFIFLISAIISAIALASGKSPKAMGILHLLYGVIFLIFAAIGTIDAGILGSWSMYDLTGFGFYVGAFSSILLMLSK